MLRVLNSPYFTLFLLSLMLLLAPGQAAAQTAGTPQVAWHYTPASGAVYGAGLSDDGADLVVVIGHGFEPGGAIVSLDPATGAERWRADIDEAPSSSPIIESGVVYAGIGSLVSGRSAVYALDAASGAVLWRTDVSNNELPATPVDGVTLGGNALFVNRADGELLALDAATGQERWSKDLQKPPRGAPAVAGETVYVSTGFDGAAILALDAATGDERWRVEAPSNPVTGPVVVDEVMFVPYGDGNLVAFDAASGAERWRATGGTPDSLGPPSPGLPLVADGAVYVSSIGFGGATTLAFDAATGAELWQLATGDFSAGPPALVNGVLLVGSDSGELLGIDPVAGVEVWRLAIPNDIHLSLTHTDPPLAGNAIYVTDDAGGIVALTM
ncbi:MAG TPA: PQQ-binding-like beta-propeller repeat protein [Thermomicrobiales bacterium]|nr:PQQ-binding-like beta-propeller repeat protein [Thermomicrobiales bacterium]